MSDALIPPVSDDKRADLRVKQLEMIQANMGRITTQATSLRGFYLSLVGALAGFAVSQRKPELMLVIIVASLLFGGLDARFLQLERGLRILFDEESRPAKWHEFPNFHVSTSRGLGRGPFRQALRSWIIRWLYLSVVVLSVLLFAILEAWPRGR